MDAVKREGSSLSNIIVSVDQTEEQILKDVSLTVEPGQIVGLAGETGSGKTTLALAFLGYASPGLSISQGSIVVSGVQVPSGYGKKASREVGAELRALRGSQVSYVPQDPGNALPSGMTIRTAFRTIMVEHGNTDLAACDERMRELFGAVGLPEGDEFADRFPHQLSGGQQQRVAIAMAFSLKPKLVVMDEPTTGLDATTTRKVVELIKQISARFHAGIVFVSHDLRLLLRLCHRVAVLYRGNIVEVRECAGFEAAAEHPYTKKLLAALPSIHVGDGAQCIEAAAETCDEPPVLSVSGLSARYGDATATHGLNFCIARGSCLAFVGESGSGKTTTARCLAGIHEDFEGTVKLCGQEIPKRLSKRTSQQKQGIQYVFQNPASALNPRKTVGESIMVPYRAFHSCSREEARSRAVDLLREVGLREDHLLALPHQLSGGQRQRVCLARALAADPQLLICDEVTSSLDVVVQGAVIDLIKRLQKERNLTVLFITHDFGLALQMADRTMVLYKGELVEEGCTSELVANPQHEYTQSLVMSAQLGE